MCQNGCRFDPCEVTKLQTRMLFAYGAIQKAHTKILRRLVPEAEEWGDVDVMTTLLERLGEGCAERREVGK